MTTKKVAGTFPAKVAGTFWGGNRATAQRKYRTMCGIRKKVAGTFPSAVGQCELSSTIEARSRSTGVWQPPGRHAGRGRVQPLAVVAFTNVPSYINRVGKLTREFRQLVDARGAALRQLSRQELLDTGKQPTENVTVQGRHATISIIVEPAGDDLRVVVQGFMPSRLLPRISNVALDGFYKRADGAVQPIPDGELREFD